MDVLSKSFSQIFTGEDKAPQTIEADTVTLKALQQEYPDLFWLTLLDFIKPNSNSKVSEGLAKFIHENISFLLNKPISNLPSGLYPNPRFLAKFLEILLEIKHRATGVELLNTITCIIEKDHSLHALIFEFIDNLISSAQFDVKVILFCILSDLFKFSSPELIKKFSSKHAELLCSSFIDSFSIPAPTQQMTFFPYYDQINLIQCLLYSVRKGIFYPFQSKFRSWDGQIRSFLTLPPVPNEPGAKRILRERIFTLYHALLTLTDDSFRIEFLQNYAREMAECSLKILETNPPLTVVHRIFKFLYIALTYPNLFREIGFVERIFGSCCAPPIATIKESPQSKTNFDTQLVDKLKKWIRDDKSFFKKSLDNFWSGDIETLFYSNYKLTLRDKVDMLIEEHYKYFDIKELDTKDVWTLQSLCLNAMISNNMTRTAIHDHQQVVFTSKDDLEIESSLHMVGKLCNNSNNPFQFFGLTHFTSFTAPTFRSRVRIAATCCLFDIYIDCSFLCDRERFDIIYSNVYDDDTILSYCSIRLLEAFETKYENTKEITSYLNEDLSRLIERTFSVVGSVSMLRPLKFILHLAFNSEEREKNLTMFTKLLCNLGDAMIETPTEMVLEFLPFLEICNQLLTYRHFFNLDNFFCNFFSYFLFILDPKCMEIKVEVVCQLADFDNFLEKAADYVVSKRKGYLEAASFLNYFIPKSQTFDQRKMELFRSIIDSSDDSTIKSNLSFFFSINGA